MRGIDPSASIVVQFPPYFHKVCFIFLWGFFVFVSLPVRFHCLDVVSSSGELRSSRFRLWIFNVMLQ